MSQTTKPVLKLSTSRAPSFSGPSSSTPHTAGDGPKIKLKLPTASQPATAAAAPQPPAPPPPALPPVKTKAGRASKPTAKLLESRKRGNDDLDDSEDELLQNRLPHSNPLKRIKLLPAVTPGGKPRINIKNRRGDVPSRVHGEGYDSCASDNEDDPLREEQIIFRMLPGPDCDYVHECLSNKKVPGMADFDFQIKFLDNDGKRVLVRVRSNYYAATLLDLPTITETMKTWDRKSFIKTADICQMLLVYAQVENEAQAATMQLPNMILPGHKWPHGLTPPMHDCIKRRFRKAISKREIQSKEDEVNRLLDLDNEFDESQYTVERPDDGENRNSDADADADGDVDDGYFGAQHGELAPNGDGEEDLGDLEQMLMDELGSDQPDAAAAVAEAITHGQQNGVTGVSFSGGANGDEIEVEVEVEEEEEEDDEDDDEEDEDGEEDDENDRAIADECRDIEKQIKEKEAQLAAQPNALLKQRLKDGLKSLRKDLELKRASIGQRD